MELLGGMQRELGMAMIVITHDLGLVATVADRVLVMYAGRGAESCDYRTISAALITPTPGGCSPRSRVRRAAAGGSSPSWASRRA